ncbi:MAG: hypothetical protein AAF202_02325 [Pseudomonadota bacterium]
MDNRKLKSAEPVEDKLAVHTETHSDLSGFKGWFERLTRRFKNLGVALALAPLVGLFVLVVSVSLYPGIVLFQFLMPLVSESSVLVKAAAYSTGAAFSYLLFALTIVFLIPAVNFILPLKVKETRGNWYSWSAIPWYYHNALVQFARFTVLEMITPTPLNVLFYKMMGMKVGKNCVINTANIWDPCLIELGDYVTIGGSATVFAHYGQGGYLIIGKTKIGSYTTIGLKASVMGCVTIGEKCSVGPHVAVLPKTVLKDREKLLK